MSSISKRILRIRRMETISTLIACIKLPLLLTNQARKRRRRPSSDRIRNPHFWATLKFWKARLLVVNQSSDNSEQSSPKAKPHRSLASTSTRFTRRVDPLVGRHSKLKRKIIIIKILLTRLYNQRRNWGNCREIPLATSTRLHWIQTHWISRRSKSAKTHLTQLLTHMTPIEATLVFNSTKRLVTHSWCPVRIPETSTKASATTPFACQWPRHLPFPVSSKRKKLGSWKKTMSKSSTTESPSFSKKRRKLWRESKKPGRKPIKCWRIKYNRSKWQERDSNKKRWLYKRPEIWCFKNERRKTCKDSKCKPRWTGKSKTPTLWRLSPENSPRSKADMIRPIWEEPRRNDSSNR